MLKLLGKLPSINVRKVAWTCAEVGLAFSREDFGAGFAPTRTPDFLALNPNAQVPVLIDGDTVLWESNTICRYLAGKMERADLLPSTPLARARVEQWMDWQATDLNGSWIYAFLALMRNHPAYTDPRQIEASVLAWNTKLSVLEQQLDKTGAFVTGDHFTLADIVLGLSVDRWLRAPIEHFDHPAIRAYHQRLCDRPDFLTYGPNGPA